MSATKRLAKRSIVGTRVSAPSKESGLFYPGLIVGHKNSNEDMGLFFNNSHPGTVAQNSRYVVRFENGDTKEYLEPELIGPGFGNMNGLKLRSGQKIWVTYNGREIMGTVVYHQPARDEVLINIQPQAGSPEIPFDVTKRLDEVRLLESRKSARLQEQDLDFARLADVSSSSSITSGDRKRSQQTASIDVPKNNYSSRKRRPSTGSLYTPILTLPPAPVSGSSTTNPSAFGVDVMDGTDECAAAMVLMSLSCSPRSPQWDQTAMISSSWSSSSSSGASSWLSTVNGSGSLPNGTGISGTSSGTESSLHFNNHSPTPSSSDDGIESDATGEWELDQPKKKKVKIIFQCTWPGCSMIKESCFEIEAHVRYAHLGGPSANGSNDHEEEFYYCEAEIPDLSPNLSSSVCGSSYGSSSSSIMGLGGMAFSPTLSHMDMVRPPSEDPEYKLSQLQLQRKSPNGNTHLIHPKKRLSPKSSPVRRPRGDTKKCRKVYGMERRDLWCTQCKWKKACSRFGD